jgi:hypothetical protein
MHEAKTTGHAIAKEPITRVGRSEYLRAPIATANRIDETISEKINMSVSTEVRSMEIRRMK